MNNITTKLLMLVCISATCSCTISGSQKAESKNQNQDDTLQMNEAIGATDLTDLLTGLWVNTLDSTFILQFKGDKMIRIEAGRVQRESIYRIDSNCQQQNCAGQIAADQSGWCFVEQGNFESHCYLVTACDKTSLQIVPLDGTKIEQFFKRSH